MEQPNSFTPNENMDMRSCMPVTPINQKPAYTLCEAVGGWLSLIFGFIFTHFACGYAGGIWGGIIWAAVGAAGAVYTRIKHIKTTRAQLALFITAEIFCIVPVIYSDGFINFLSALFSFVILLYLAITVSGAEMFGRHFVLDSLQSVFVRPFLSFGAAPCAAFSLFKGKSRSKNVLYALLGLIAAIPVTVLVVNLLIRSDSAFEGMMNGIAGIIPELSGTLVAEVIFAIPTALFLFGAVFSMNKPAAVYRDCAPDYRVIPPALSYAAATPLCVFYLLYFLSQFSYFTSAFGGTLPSGFSLSEYARRGFFELCFIAVINLLVIMVMQAFTRRGENDSRPAALKIYTVVLSGFSLLLIASAVSKMIMYISRLGMTRLRLYTTWFMAVLAAAFVLIIIWQFRDMRFWRAMFAAFTVLMALLCFGCPDGIAARYNISAFESGAHEELDVDLLKYDLGTAAVIPAAEYYARGVSDEHTRISLAVYLERAARDLAETDCPEYFSIERALAVSALKNAGFTVPTETR